MLCTHHRTASGGLPISILDAESGAVVKTWEQPLHRHKEVEFIDLLNEDIWLRQATYPLQIYDVRPHFCPLLRARASFSPPGR